MAEQTTEPEGQDGTERTDETVTDETVTLTQAELALKLQQEGDRRVQQSNKTIKEAAAKEQKEALEAERKKAEEEQLRAENKYQEIAERRESELRTLRASNAASELRADTQAMLAEKGLADVGPVFDADLMSLDGRTAAADSLNTLIEAQVEARVSERLKTDPPPKGDGVPPKGGKDLQDMYGDMG